MSDNILFNFFAVALRFIIVVDFICILKYHRKIEILIILTSQQNKALLNKYHVWSRQESKQMNILARCIKVNDGNNLSK